MSPSPLSLLLLLSASPSRAAVVATASPALSAPAPGPLVALPECASPLPRHEPVRRTDYAFSWAESERMFARYYHCAQPRMRYAWKPRADGGADAVMDRGGEVAVHVPRSFVEKTLLHMETIVRAGHARRIYFIDWDHGHFDMPKSRMAEAYLALWNEGRWAELMHRALGDPALRIVYHTQELIEPKEPPRELQGTYEDPPRVIAMDTLPKEEALAMRRGMQGLFTLSFEAHPQGAYALFDGSRFDFSFEDDGWDQGFRKINVLFPAQEDHGH
ncbi:MAG: hypothetical protein HY078_15680 [Elusimicrobia bacterium]|nr:hypothetical protein [Elusimicrobiota bacterium]